MWDAQSAVNFESREVTMDLKKLIDPATTVLVTMEMQQGIVGELSGFQELRSAATESGVLTNGPRLCEEARDSGVTVIHATAVNRSDYAGSIANCRMLAASKKMNENGSGITEGSVGAEIISDFGPEPQDIVLPRLHGLTPFTSTSLDQVIRNLGARTIIPIGVSINIGILGLVISAVDLGYQVVVPTDAVAGVPHEYGQTIMEGSISLLATLTSTEDIVAAWTTS